MSTMTCAICGKECKRTGSRQKYCKECVKQREREYNRAYLENNRERAREYSRAWHENNRERVLERQCAWREDNREYKRELQRAHRKKNKKQVDRAIRQRHELLQEVTKEHATVTGRWLPAEDAVVASWEGTDLELALALGRTYHAVHGRKQALRAKARAANAL